MSQSRRNCEMDVMLEALFELTERAQALAAKRPPADHGALLKRLRAIGQAGADIETLAAAMVIIERHRKSPHT